MQSTKLKRQQSSKTNVAKKYINNDIITNKNIPTKVVKKKQKNSTLQIHVQKNGVQSLSSARQKQKQKEKVKNGETSFNDVVTKFKKLFDQKIKFVKDDVNSFTDRVDSKPKKFVPYDVGNISENKIKNSTNSSHNLHLQKRQIPKQGFSQIIKDFQAKLNKHNKIKQRIDRNDDLLESISDNLSPSTLLLQHLERNRNSNINLNKKQKQKFYHSKSKSKDKYRNIIGNSHNNKNQKLTFFQSIEQNNKQKQKQRNRQKQKQQRNKSKQKSKQKSKPHRISSSKSKKIPELITDKSKGNLTLRVKQKISINNTNTNTHMNPSHSHHNQNQLSENIGQGKYKNRIKTFQSEQNNNDNNNNVQVQNLKIKDNKNRKVSKKSKESKNVVFSSSNIYANFNGNLGKIERINGTSESHQQLKIKKKQKINQKEQKHKRTKSPANLLALPTQRQQTKQKHKKDKQTTSKQKNRLLKKKKPPKTAMPTDLDRPNKPKEPNYKEPNYKQLKRRSKMDSINMNANIFQDYDKVAVSSSSDQPEFCSQQEEYKPSGSSSSMQQMSISDKPSKNSQQQNSQQNQHQQQEQSQQSECLSLQQKQQTYIFGNEYQQILPSTNRYRSKQHPKQRRLNNIKGSVITYDVDQQGDLQFHNRHSTKNGNKPTYTYSDEQPQNPSQLQLQVQNNSQVQLQQQYCSQVRNVSDSVLNCDCLAHYLIGFLTYVEYIKKSRLLEQFQGVDNQNVGESATVTNTKTNTNNTNVTYSNYNNSDNANNNTSTNIYRNKQELTANTQNNPQQKQVKQPTHSTNQHPHENSHHKDKQDNPLPLHPPPLPPPTQQQTKYIQIEHALKQQQLKWLNLKLSLQRIRNANMSVNNQQANNFVDELDSIIMYAQENHLILKAMEIKDYHGFGSYNNGNANVNGSANGNGNVVNWNNQVGESNIRNIINSRSNSNIMDQQDYNKPTATFIPTDIDPSTTKNHQNQKNPQATNPKPQTPTPLPTTPSKLVQIKQKLQNYNKKLDNMDDLGNILGQVYHDDDDQYTNTIDKVNNKYDDKDNVEIVNIDININSIHIGNQKQDSPNNTNPQVSNPTTHPHPQHELPAIVKISQGISYQQSQFNNKSKSNKNSNQSNISVAVSKTEYINYNGTVIKQLQIKDISININKSNIADRNSQEKQSFKQIQKQKQKEKEREGVIQDISNMQSPINQILEFGFDEHLGQNQEQQILVNQKRSKFVEKQGRRLVEKQEQFGQREFDGKQKELGLQEFQQYFKQNQQKIHQKQQQLHQQKVLPNSIYKIQQKIPNSNPILHKTKLNYEQAPLQIRKILSKPPPSKQTLQQKYTKQKEKQQKMLASELQFNQFMSNKSGISVRSSNKSSRIQGIFKDDEGKGVEYYSEKNSTGNNVNNLSDNKQHKQGKHTQLDNNTNLLHKQTTTNPQRPQTRKIKILQQIKSPTNFNINHKIANLQHHLVRNLMNTHNYNSNQTNGHSNNSLHHDHHTHSYSNSNVSNDDKRNIREDWKNNQDFGDGYQGSNTNRNVTIDNNMYEAINDSIGRNRNRNRDRLNNNSRDMNNDSGSNINNNNSSSRSKIKISLFNRKKHQNQPIIEPSQQPQQYNSYNNTRMYNSQLGLSIHQHHPYTVANMDTNVDGSEYKKSIKYQQIDGSIFNSSSFTNNNNNGNIIIHRNRHAAKDFIIFKSKTNNNNSNSKNSLSNSSYNNINVSSYDNEIDRNQQAQAEPSQNIHQDYSELDKDKDKDNSESVLHRQKIEEKQIVKQEQEYVIDASKQQQSAQQPNGCQHQPEQQQQQKKYEYPWNKPNLPLTQTINPKLSPLTLTQNYAQELFPAGPVTSPNSTHPTHIHMDDSTKQDNNNTNISIQKVADKLRTITQVRVIEQVDTHTPSDLHPNNQSFNGSKKDQDNDNNKQPEEEQYYQSQSKDTHNIKQNKFVLMKPRYLLSQLQDCKQEIIENLIDQFIYQTIKRHKLHTNAHILNWHQNQEESQQQQQYEQYYELNRIGQDMIQFYNQINCIQINQYEHGQEQLEESEQHGQHGQAEERELVEQLQRQLEIQAENYNKHVERQRELYIREYGNENKNRDRQGSNSVERSSYSGRRHKNIVVVDDNYSYNYTQQAPKLQIQKPTVDNITLFKQINTNIAKLDKLHQQYYDEQQKQAQQQQSETAAKNKNRNILNINIIQIPEEQNSSSINNSSVVSTSICGRLENDQRDSANSDVDVDGHRTSSQYINQNQNKQNYNQHQEQEDIQHQFEQQNPYPDMHLVQYPQNSSSASIYLKKDTNFIINLTISLLDFIHQDQSRYREFMRRLKKPLGIDTLQLLKILRDSDDGVENLMSYANNSNNNNGGGDNGCQFGEENQGIMEQDDFDSYYVISLQTFIVFEETNQVGQSTTYQQFFNQSVYDKINMILDMLKPYGNKGLPAMNFMHRYKEPDPSSNKIRYSQNFQLQNPSKFSKIQTFEHIKYFVLQALIQDLKIELGCMSYNINSDKIREYSIKKMVEQYMRQLQEQWRTYNQGQFQVKHTILFEIQLIIFQMEFEAIWEVIKKRQLMNIGTGN